MKVKLRVIVAIFAVILVAVGVTVAILGVRYQRAHEYIVLTDEQIAEVLAANEGLTDKQQTVVDACVSLVGKVHYFWGGKSDAIGWDENWNVPTEVTSVGSETTGTIRPYGLDCSGYVSWVFLQLGDSPQYVNKTIGQGTRNQWDNSTKIEWRELRVGDIVFQNQYPKASGNHVGICIGFYEDKPVFAHCAYSEDAVVVTTAGEVFHFARRPQPFVHIQTRTSQSYQIQHITLCRLVQLAPHGKEYIFAR